MSKPITLQEHLKKIQSLGGKAFYKKVGKKGMIELAKRGAKKRKKNNGNKNQSK